MRITIAIYAEDEKVGSGIERFAFEGIGQVYAFHLTEDSGHSFEVGSDGALFGEIRFDNQSSFGMTDEGLNYVACFGNVYNVFDTTPMRVKSRI